MSEHVEKRFGPDDYNKQGVLKTSVYEAELLRLQRLGRRALPQLTAETLVVVSRADATVPFEVAELIRTRSNASRFATVAVDRSNHHLAEHVDRRLVADAVVDWFADRD